MLAEIFLLQLENRVRTARDQQAETPRYVPLPNLSEKLSQQAGIR